MSEEQEKIGTILIVDNTEANVLLLVEILSGEYSVKFASKGREALAIAEVTPPDLILLDIIMPEMDGYEVCRRLKANPRLREIPVIFLSVLETVDVKLKAFSAGGVDYINKPFQVKEVQARVKTQIMNSKLQLRLKAQNLVLEQTITERSQLDIIVESSNDAIFSVSLQGLITSWNRGRKKFLVMLPGRSLAVRYSPLSL